MSVQTPIVTEMRVVPIAGHDSMLLNLSGAHGPFFTRNLVILKDSDGNTGVGEVPGGAADPDARSRMPAHSSRDAASAPTTRCSPISGVPSPTATPVAAAPRPSICGSPCTR